MKPSQTGFLPPVITGIVSPIFSLRFLKFCSVGASGVVVNLGCLRLFKGLGLQINLASALAIEVSILSNLVINTLWTFRDKNEHARGFLTQATRFHLVSFVGGAVQFFTFVVLNMIWLLTLYPWNEVSAYHAAASNWLERWLWHPFVAPPDVGSWIYLSQLIGIGVATFWNYLANFHWTWASRTSQTS